MAVIPVVLWERQLQNWWFRLFRPHFTDRCVRTPDTCHHTKEGVHSISVLSKSHSGIKKNHGLCKISEWKNTFKTRESWHTCVLVTCIRTYIYNSLIGLPKCNRGIQPLLLDLQTKLEILRCRDLVIMSEKTVKIYRLHKFGQKYFVNDEIN